VRRLFKYQLHIMAGRKVAYNGPRNGCCGRIADMPVPEALRVDTDGGIKPDMAFLALLCECKPGMLPYINFPSARLPVFVLSSRRGSCLPRPSRNRTSRFPTYGSSFSLRRLTFMICLTPICRIPPIAFHPLSDDYVCSSTGDLPWNTSLCGHYPASSLRPSGLYPRSIPEPAASDAPPVTLSHHTSLLRLWHRRLHEDLLRLLAWLLHHQCVQLDAV